jgi:hypothetical protein
VSDNCPHLPAVRSPGRGSTAGPGHRSWLGAGIDPSIRTTTSAARTQSMLTRPDAGSAAEQPHHWSTSIMITDSLQDVPTGMITNSVPEPGLSRRQQSLAASRPESSSAVLRLCSAGI